MIRAVRIISALLLSVMLFASCSPDNVDIITGSETTDPPKANVPGWAESDSLPDDKDSEESTDITYEGHGDIIENPFVDPSKNPTSSVTATSDTSSYKYFCNLVNSGYTLSELKKCSYDFKPEEFMNYLSLASSNYGDSGISADIKFTKCLWNKENYFLKITFGMNEADNSKKGDNNFVFYIDVSDSMYGKNMLPMLQSSFFYFAKAIGEGDTVSVITSDPESPVILDSVSGENTKEIISAFENLTSKGAANNHDGLRNAFELAIKNLDADANNKVIIISDGDMSEKYSAVAYEYYNKGIELTVVGLGSGNHRNRILEGLARSGGGEYFYIDSPFAAKSFFNTDIFNRSRVLADSLDIKVAFNSKTVSKYRLIGYEGKSTGGSGDDLSDNYIYVGDKITLCYEISLDEEKYLSYNSELANISLVYKDAVSGEDKAFSACAYFGDFTDEDDEMRLIMCAAEALMVLKGSAYVKNVKLSDVYLTVKDVDTDMIPQASEFIGILEKIISKDKK